MDEKGIQFNEMLTLMILFSIDDEMNEIVPEVCVALGGITAAIRILGDPKRGSEDNEIKDSAQGLLESIAHVVDSSKFIHDIDIENQINDLTSSNE